MAKKKAVKKSASKVTTVKIETLTGKRHSWLVTPSGLRISSNSRTVEKPEEVGFLLGKITKPSSRAVRKALRREGLTALAAAERR